jgi:hypothetical protein
MLSSILRSKRAVAVNTEIMRTFVKLREMMLSHKDLSRRLDALKEKYDAQFKVVLDAIRQLMAPPALPGYPDGRSRVRFRTVAATETP